MRNSVLGAIFVGEELLVVKRQDHLKVFPGYYPFPGGKVDKTDEDEVFALKRELKEELSIDLFEMDPSEILDIYTIGIARTPDFNPYKFETHIFVVKLKTKPEFKIDEGELNFAKWMNIKDIHQQYLDGKALMVPPASYLIKMLAENVNSKKVHELTLKYDDKTQVPFIEPVGGLIQFLPLSHTFPPANRTNAFLFGDEKKFLVDFSPKDEKEYQKLKHTLSQYKLDGLIVSHHHPDHHEKVFNYALEMKLDVWMSEDTKDRLTNKYGVGHFQKVTIHLIKEGDVITKSGGYDVKVLEVPGHDEGQIAFLREDKAWMIVGDLIQTVGTVVIGGDEGDMDKYFKSLQRVIDIAPEVVFPSHGIGIGGTFQIERTLKHRMAREEDIISLLKVNKNKQEILETIYFDIDPGLHPYAMKTIEAHIKRIQTLKLV